MITGNQYHIPKRMQFRKFAPKSYSVTLSILEPKHFAGNTISSRIFCHTKALWKLSWFLRDFGYETELPGRDEVDEKRAIGLTGVVKISNVVDDGMALLCFASMALHRRVDGRNYPPPTLIGRLLNDVQLYADQPLPVLPATVSKSVFGRLARKLGRYLCEVREGQYWRLEKLKSFDEFLARRFPESRRKVYT
ncbi:MAG TPA: hypothetical protein VJP02_28170 [Candidatus Sulfotelmatobacter sp.]|nr:hypothetical protein [Candidatus Sulfotelmatobacter sp.]